MKIAPGTPLEVTLQWDDRTAMPVGRLAYRDGQAWLEYTPDFLASGLQLSPLHHQAGLGLETAWKRDVFEGLHGMFADSLPDGWGRLLVDRRARQLGFEPSQLTPLDRLACVGRRGVGALTYAPAMDVWDGAEGALDLDRLAADAARVLAGEAGAVIAALGQAGGSPAGARPKALIALNAAGEARHGSDAIPEGYDGYLVKFPGRDDPADIAAIEYAYALMARAAGVIMPDVRLIEGPGEVRYFATRRFDREGDARLHVHSACGLLYSDFRLPALDYRELIRLARAVTRDRREAIAMYRLAVFNVLARNRDDHAKQFSFLMDRDGRWSLAPAYDLVFTDGPGGEHSTSVLGHGRDIGRETLVRLGAEADLDAAGACEVIDTVSAAVADWARFAADAGVSRASLARIADGLAAVRV
ncbi:type II toxin-antitoxin system HipA family toxin [Maricaulis sp.]|uniref:type II toxin-antitoxin system HipA family toxin n=1 Tax=Maricaulis sp. TaxID=1486257 RepID=UPI0025BCD5BF|nr:type II toxin-antitoxin system HipA family toxin [Maricaulis sp.]